MKIAFMGAANSGKTTLINQFIKNWPQFTLSTNTYRDLIKEKNLNINKEGTEESQKIILQSLVDEVNSVKDSTQNIVFDRCVIDNLVYSLWLYNYGKVSQDFIVDCKYKVRDAVTKYDIIFYTPRSKSLKIVEKDTREIDESYIDEIDNLFSAVVGSYEKGKDVFLPLDNCPAVITLNGPPDLRCEMIKLYLKGDGSIFTEEDGSLIYS